MKQQLICLAQIAASFEKQGDIRSGTILTEALRKIAQDIPQDIPQDAPQEEVDPAPLVADTSEKKRH